ncbi:MAG: anhydro-N-acetylmuramic acid kinase [Firmicutes bacterium]|nr:anhydro-N-acetylmuramic acid kinase [Bacillota bacterium]
MKKLIQLMNKQKKLVIGLMSGTSIDGVDCALVEIEGNGLDTKVKLLEFCNYPMEDKLKGDILKACSKENSSVDLICKLNFEIGEIFSKAVYKTCKKAGVKVKDIDLIGSHGQTIYHIPKHSTLQIGEPSVIRERTGIVTVADFRVRDVAAGGHGAPLVPYTEYILYRNLNKTIALQNIGGIGNVTIIPKASKLEEVYAFDTGPGNMMMDEVVKEITQGKLKYDKDGKFALKGRVNKELLKELLAHPYIIKKPPKTTGREEFGQDFSLFLLDKYRSLGVDIYDILTTFTYFTAKSIADSYKNWVIPKHNLDEVIIGGGGSYNKTLLNMLRNELDSVKIKTQEDIGSSSDAKEAVAFAILANETIHGNTNNVSNVTKAERQVVMGKIVY